MDRRSAALMPTLPWSSQSLTRIDEVALRCTFGSPGRPVTQGHQMGLSRSKDVVKPRIPCQELQSGNQLKRTSSLPGPLLDKKPGCPLHSSKRCLFCVLAALELCSSSFILFTSLAIILCLVVTIVNIQSQQFLLGNTGWPGQLSRLQRRGRQARAPVAGPAPRAAHRVSQGLRI